MNLEEGLSKAEQAGNKIVEANHMVTDAIMNNFLFTWRWWVLVGFLVLPWALWAIVRDKKSTARLLLPGFFVMVVAAILDTQGVEHGKWSYPIKVIPSATISYTYRFSIMPVLVMLFLQFKPRINPFLKAVTFAVLCSYVGLPLMGMIDLYRKIDWAYTYSFLILFAVYLCAHWLSRRSSFAPLTEPEGKGHNRDGSGELRLDLLRRKEKAR